MKRKRTRKERGGEREREEKEGRRERQCRRSSDVRAIVQDIEGGKVTRKEKRKPYST